MKRPAGRTRETGAMIRRRTLRESIEEGHAAAILINDVPVRIKAPRPPTDLRPGELSRFEDGSVWRVVRVGKCSPRPAVMVAVAPGAGRQSAAPSQKSCVETSAEATTNRQHMPNRFFMMAPRRRGRRLDATQTPAVTRSAGVPITGGRLSGSEEFLKSSSGFDPHDSPQARRHRAQPGL